MICLNVITYTITVHADALVQQKSTLKAISGL
uniref:Uncharacterized protein n=1 Tax=Anguilla anguilla TaxID=7936 RepID=A0A0E9WEN8_ANGAN